MLGYLVKEDLDKSIRYVLKGLDKLFCPRNGVLPVGVLPWLREARK